jgi:hypothetical protein
MAKCHEIVMECTCKLEADRLALDIDQHDGIYYQDWRTENSREAQTAFGTAHPH